MLPGWKIGIVALAVPFMALALTGCGSTTTITEMGTVVTSTVTKTVTVEVPRTVSTTLTITQTPAAITTQAPPTSTLAQVPRLSAAAAKCILESGQAMVLVDVRKKGEFDLGHISGALSIPVGELASRYVEIPHTPLILVYAACN